MPELPEVETVRRMLEANVRGRRVRSVAISGAGLRGVVPRGLSRALRGRTIREVRRHGKFLLVELDGDRTLLSHLGMSGRWLFHAEPRRDPSAHVHVRLGFEDGTALWFEDPRRFGMVRVVPTRRLARDPSLAILGPDPIATPPTGASLAGLARGARVAVKGFLLDQKRLAGVGNIYASEILHRAAIDPRRRAGALTAAEWDRVAAEVGRVLAAAIAGQGTTFQAYRTPEGTPGAYADRLLVYDRAGEPCRTCGGAIRRIVQGGRSTYFCPTCQRRPPPARGAQTGVRKPFRRARSRSGSG